MTGSRTRVLLVFGGISGEHGISCATADGIYQAIDRERYEIIPVGITPAGRWVKVDFAAHEFALTDSGTAQVPDSADSIFLAPGCGKVLSMGRGKSSALELISELGPIDVALPLLHGPFGEDGTIQGLFEMLQLPYVGCGVLASAACMEKITTKTLLKAAGIPCGKWVGVPRKAWVNQRQDLLAEIRQLRLPLFVKPSRAGSSLGVSKVTDFNSLETAIEQAQKYDPLVIVEEGLTGLEVECAVLEGPGDQPPRVTVPGQIAMGEQAAFYDYQTKYFGEHEVSLKIPAPIDQELSERVRDYSRRAFEVLQCEGLARVDFFVDPQLRTVTVNEINTMPGFTPFSMYPKLWEASGLGYRELLGELLELALERGTGLH